MCSSVAWFPTVLTPFGLIVSHFWKPSPLKIECSHCLLLFYSFCRSLPKSPGSNFSFFVPGVAFPGKKYLNFLQMSTIKVLFGNFTKAVKLLLAAKSTNTFFYAGAESRSFIEMVDVLPWFFLIPPSWGKTLAVFSNSKSLLTSLPRSIG